MGSSSCLYLCPNEIHLCFQPDITSQDWGPTAVIPCLLLYCPHIVQEIPVIFTPQIFCSFHSFLFSYPHHWCALVSHYTVSYTRVAGNSAISLCVIGGSMWTFIGRIIAALISKTPVHIFFYVSQRNHIIQIYKSGRKHAHICICAPYPGNTQLGCILMSFAVSWIWRRLSLLPQVRWSKEAI